MVAVGCGPKPRVAAPNVIFISLDTLRRDRVGVYSHSEPSLTPAIDALARDSVLFSGAHVQMPFTQVSHMSMFTGLYPEVHGTVDELHALPYGHVTLPEYMKRAGFRTIGVYTCQWLAGVFGFERGFDSYESLGSEWDLTYADRVAKRGLEAFDAQTAGGDPLFLFLHFYDAHSDLTTDKNRLPYFSPAQYRADFVPDPMTREFCDDAGNCATEALLAGDSRLNERLLHSQIESGMKIKLNPGKAPLSAEQYQRMGKLYDRGVRYLDDDLGAFFNTLKKRGLYDAALIVLTADHGEEFGEHGFTLHAQPYEEATAVPLMIKFPKGEHRGRVVNGLVDSVDILPTILEYLGIPQRAPIEGRSLLPAIATGSTDRRFSLSQDQIQRTRFSITVGDNKLIYDFTTRQAELFDLVADPGERTNIIADRLDVGFQLGVEVFGLVTAQRSHGALLQVRQSGPTNQNASAGAGGAQSLLPAQELQRLRSLGYVR
jgi:arylsulfatase A-like enzyme